MPEGIGKNMPQENRQPWFPIIAIVVVFLGSIVGSPQKLLAQGTDCSTAEAVEVNTTLVRTLNAGDRHFYSITLPGEGLLTVSTEGVTDTVGTLIGPDGIEIVTNSSGGEGRNFLISRAALAPGVYCVDVRGESANTLGLYRLRVEGDFINPPATCDGQDVTIHGTEGDDVIPGTAGNDVIAGFGGNDVIYGLGGNDVICGGEGDDVIFGGDRDDRLFGDAGNDRLMGEGGNNAILDVNERLGDVNQDNRLTPADALCVFREFLNLASCLD